MSQKDITYYAARLRAELAAAAAATSDGARDSHEGLAHLYAELLSGRGDRPLPGGVIAGHRAHVPGSTAALRAGSGASHFSGLR